MVTLTVDGRVVPITSSRVVIGRSRECDVRVDDGNVSRRHCEVVQESPTDLGRRRPRLDERDGAQRPQGLAPDALDDGDRITIGGTDLVFGRSVQ